MIIESKALDDQSTCIICLEDFEQTPQMSRVQLLCGHIWHQKCLDDWIRKEPQCPFRCEVELSYGQFVYLSAVRGAMAVNSFINDLLGKKNQTLPSMSLIPSPSFKLFYFYLDANSSRIQKSCQLSLAQVIFPSDVSLDLSLFHWRNLTLFCRLGGALGGFIRGNTDYLLEIKSKTSLSSS